MPFEYSLFAKPLAVSQPSQTPACACVARTTSLTTFCYNYSIDLKTLHASGCHIDDEHSVGNFKKYKRIVCPTGATILWFSIFRFLFSVSQKQTTCSAISACRAAMTALSAFSRVSLLLRKGGGKNTDYRNICICDYVCY